MTIPTPREVVDFVFERIKHGDQRHQDWLRDELTKTLAPAIAARDAQVVEACRPPTLTFYLLEAASVYETLAEYPTDTIDVESCTKLAAKLREHARPIVAMDLYGEKATKEGNRP